MNQIRKLACGILLALGLTALLSGCGSLVPGRAHVETIAAETAPAVIPSESASLSDLPEASTEAPEAASPLMQMRSAMEMGVPDHTFRDMEPSKEGPILEEYGSLLDDHILSARESEDGSISYILGFFPGDPQENPFRDLYSKYGGEQDSSTMVLYNEESDHYRDKLHGNPLYPPDSYVIKNSEIAYSQEDGWVMILPKESEISLEALFIQYLFRNGPDYIADAASRGVVLYTPKEPYLQVYLISEKWGEIAENIPLTQAEADTILTEALEPMEEGHGFLAKLYAGEERTMFADFSGVSPTVLNLAMEKCWYQFSTPKDIRSPIVEAELACNWLDEPGPLYCEDLKELERILKNAKSSYIGACGYGANLTIRMEDGSRMVIFKGTDGCGSLAFGSYGGYLIGDKDNQKFWQLFGLDPQTKEIIK